MRISNWTITRIGIALLFLDVIIDTKSYGMFGFWLIIEAIIRAIREEDQEND